MPLLLLGLCPCIVSVCEGVMVPHVDAVDAVTVMCVLLFVFGVYKLRV